MAFFAPLLAPWDPYAFVDERDVPPWTNSPILANSTYFSFSVSGWANMTYGQAIDGRSASSAIVNDSVVVSAFGVRVLRDSVNAVAYAVFLDGSATWPGQYLGCDFRSYRGVVCLLWRELRTYNLRIILDCLSRRGSRR